ncbi:MAG TPA: GNAT family N-acetyltransferase [Puia sp.]|nr:GNAT family N-acetyltransferase [Puia sp.]
MVKAKSTSMVQIRIATDIDLQQMLDIYNDIITNTTAVFQYAPHTLEMRKEWLAQKQKDGFPVFVAQETDEVIGFSTIGSFRNWQAYKYSVENSVYVRSDKRGKGVGKLLLKETINAAKQMGMHTIIAGIDASNETSIAMHRQFGFVEVAYFKEVGYKFDRWLDLIFLQVMI